MEGSVRSGHGVLKKKGSSGCLIIKKKDGASTMGMGSSSTASQQKLKKRSRLSDSESSEEELSQPIRRRGGDKFHNASVTSGGESREFARNIKGFESERKRSRLDLFDFDEYDELHEEKQWRTNMMVAEKNTHSNTESLSGSRANKDEYGGVKKRHDIDEDEAHMPISLLRMKYKDSSQEPIRLQGKNGVLKVMVSNNKKIDVSRNKDSDLKSRRGSRYEDVVKKELLGRPSFNSDTKYPEKRPLSMTTTEQSELKSQKRFLPKCSKSVDAEKDGTDTSLKLAPPSSKIRAAKEESSRSAAKGATPANSKEGQLKRRGSMEKQQQIKPVSSKTRLIKGERRSVAAQDFTPAKSKETKLKRGGSTEKQQLRERIRGMLIEAGWTIDYRPRRNRDYLDAVYISPSRTAYWSIVKAYDALQKQSGEDSGKSKVDSFAPLSNDLINKLTRQTRKKIEKEMKKKRKDDANFLKKRKDDARNRDYKQSTSSESSEDTDGEHSEERISSYLNIKKKGKFLKGKFHATDQDSDSDTSNSLKGGRVKQVMSGKSSIGAASSSVQGRKSGRCTLLVRRSDKEQDSDSDGFVPYTGKRTLLAWMIDSGTVKLSAKVQYMNRRGTRVKLQGWITRDGIHCACCSKILPVSKFELHAGSTLRQPFQNIMLESGISLLECLVDAWNRQEESQREDFHTVDVDGDDPDDDTCGICGDGGDLICCDGCPSTFHQSCLGIQMLPPGDWHCPNCTCKFCGTACTTAEDGEGAQDVLLYCSLCEKKYHKSCSLDINALPASSNSPSVSFCGQECQQVDDHLQKILGVKHEIETGFSWSLIQRTDLDSNASPLQVECNSKLAVALAIMDECFLPIVDRKSGINIIHNVLYNCGSNFSRLNFRGFYTAILERGDEIISAASIRIHGTQLAEMPYIGTRNIYRRQGMCRRLLSAIETVLSSLKVEKLIIPAISEHMHTWTVVFGFNPLAQSEKLEMKSINMLVFPGTDMLQKRLLNGKTPGAGTNPQLPALVEKVDQDTPTSSAGNLCDEACVNEVNEGVDAMDSDSPVTAMDLNDTGIVGAQSADCGYDTQISSKEGRSVKSNVQSELAESSTTSMPPSSSSGASIGYAGSGDAAFKKVGEGVDAMDSDSPVTSVDLNEQSADCGSDILISSKEGRSVKSNVQKELAKSSAKLMPSSSSGASIGNADSKDVAFKKVNDSVDAVDSDSPATAMDLNDTGMIGVQTADCGYNMQISGEGRSVKSNVPNDVAESSTKSMPSSPSGASIGNAGSVDAAFKKVNEGVDAMDSDSPATAVDLNGTGMIGVQTADCGHNIEISGKEGRSVKSNVLKELAESSAKSMPSSSSGASIENTGSGDAAFTKLDEGVDAIDSPATAVNLNDTGMVGAQSADCGSDSQISSKEATSVKSNVEKELAELTTASIPSYPSGNTDLVNAALGPSTKVDAQSSDSPVTSVDLNEQGADCGPDIVISSKEGISVKSNVQKKLAESSTKFMPSSSGASIENAGSGDAAFVKLDEGVDASDSPATAVGLNDTGMVGAESADCGSDIQISSKVAISVKSNIEKELAELTTTSMPSSPSGASTGNTDLVNATLGPSTKVDAQSSEPVARLLCDQKAKTTTSSVFGIDISDEASARKINEEKQTEEISVATSTDGSGIEPAAQSAIVDIKSSACVAATCAGENGLGVPSKQIANISLEGNLDASPINSLGEAYANAALENNTDYQLDSSCEAKVAVETL